MKRRQWRRLFSLILLCMTLAVAWQAESAEPAAPAQPVGSDQSQPVLEVYDGDTIAVQLHGRVEKVRLIGVDTPEVADPRKPVQCFGKAASAWTKALLEGQSVRLQTDPTQGERDKYDRLLAYVWRDDGIFINLQLIETGHAHEYTYNHQAYLYQEAFQQAEAHAEAAQRGFWAPETCGGNTTQPARES